MWRMAAAVIAISLAACAELPKGQERPQAPVFEGLRVGMTEEAFLTQRTHRSFRPDPAPVKMVDYSPQAQFLTERELPVAIAPAPAHSVRRNGNRWDVWVYDVDRQKSPASWEADHREYAIFKNGRLEAWGMGEPPSRVVK